MSRAGTGIDPDVLEDDAGVEQADAERMLPGLVQAEVQASGRIALQDVLAPFGGEIVGVDVEDGRFAAVQACRIARLPALLVVQGG